MLGFIFALPNEALPVEHTINLITYKEVLLESLCALKNAVIQTSFVIAFKKEEKVFGMVSIVFAMAADSIHNCFNRTLEINAQNRSNMRKFSF